MRIVSLVPSHSETLVAIGAGDALVGVTRYCLDSPLVATTRARAVGGTKTPDVGLIEELRPDIVVVCDEENRIEDVSEIEALGFSVVAVSPRSVEEAAEAVLLLGSICDRLRQARSLSREIERVLEWARERTAGEEPLDVFVPIWYRPWMTFNDDTYCASVLSATGARNVFSTCRANRSRRYFEVSIEEIEGSGARAALLPTEPFRFSERHRRLLEERLGRAALVDGKALTWYGYRTPHGIRAIAGVVEALRKPEAQRSG